MWGGVEGGFHESQSRFVENIIGRSRAYWQHAYPAVQAAFAVFQDVSLEQFYQGINKVQPGWQRITADEVSYSLHVILRFELERDWFAGKISTEDLPAAWSDKSFKYLGLRPQDDVQGVLQDMHWAGDYIGYFQSYALGNIYDGQILAALKQDLPQWAEFLAAGNFAPVTDWLRQKIWRWGCSLTGADLLQGITGSRRLDARLFLQYLQHKYGQLYQLEE